MKLNKLTDKDVEFTIADGRVIYIYLVDSDEEFELYQEGDELYKCGMFNSAEDKYNDSDINVILDGYNYDEFISDVNHILDLEEEDYEILLSTKKFAEEIKEIETTCPECEGEKPADKVFCSDKCKRMNDY